MKVVPSVAIGLAVVVALGWVKSCRDLEAVTANAERRVQTFKDSLALMHQRDTLRLQAIDSLQQVQATALDSVIIFRPTRGRIDTVLRIVPESIRVEVAGIVDSLEQSVEHCLVAVRACDDRADSLAQGWANARRLLVIAEANQDSTLADIRGLRPGFNLKPAIGAGGFAGICTTGKPCVGLGVTLTWNLPFLP